MRTSFLTVSRRWLLLLLLLYCRHFSWWLPIFHTCECRPWSPQHHAHLSRVLYTHEEPLTSKHVRAVLTPEKSLTGSLSPTRHNRVCTHTARHGAPPPYLPTLLLVCCRHLLICNFFRSTRRGSCCGACPPPARDGPAGQEWRDVDTAGER